MAQPTRPTQPSIPAASSPTLVQDNCAWLTLVRFSSVGRKPTWATEPSEQLDHESGIICRRTSDSRTCHIAVRTVAEDVFIWSVDQSAV